MRDAGVPFQRKELVHGSVYRYDEGCRCVDCRAAKAAYQKASVARQRGGAKPSGASPNSGSRQERGLSPDLVADERNGHAGAGEPRRVGQAVETAVAAVSPEKRWPATARHGTWNAYTNLHCRCDACRAAASRYTADYLREWRDAHRKAGLCILCNAPADGKGGCCRRHYEGNQRSRWNMQRRKAGLPPLSQEEWRAINDGATA